MRKHKGMFTKNKICFYNLIDTDVYFITWQMCRALLTFFILSLPSRASTNHIRISDGRRTIIIV